MVIALIQKVVAVVVAASKLPANWSDPAALSAYFTGIAEPLAELIAFLVQQRPTTAVHVSSELDAAAADELAARGAQEVPPWLITAIVQAILWLLSLRRKEASQ